MNSADKKLLELNDNIFWLSENDLKKDIGENINWKILTCFLRDFETPYHKWELTIGLSAWQETFNKDNTNSWEMSFKYKKNRDYRVSITYSTLNNSFLVHKNGWIYYSSNAKDLWWKYPRAWNENSALEQVKFNTMVKQWANIMIKILNNKDNEV